MNWAELARRPVPWATTSEARFPFVIHTRLLSFRNFAGEPFPISASAQALGAVVARARPELAQWGCAEIHRLADCEVPLLRMLRERGLFADPSLPLRGRKAFKLLALASDARAWGWVNEVEHLTFAQVHPGFLPHADFAAYFRPPSEKADHLPWAWTSRHGYLASDPARIGPGFSAEILAHLPGLALSRRLPQAHNAMTALNVGFLPVTRMETGERESALFRLRSTAGLGLSPGETYRRFLGSVELLLQWEAEAQSRCCETRREKLMDAVGNAMEKLVESGSLPYPEMLARASLVRLGSYVGMINPQIPTLLEELRIAAQTGHLQVSAGRILSQEEEDTARANVVRLTLERGRAG
jgi:protein arginine kinase